MSETGTSGGSTLWRIEDVKVPRSELINLLELLLHHDCRSWTLNDLVPQWEKVIDRYTTTQQKESRDE